MAAQNKTSPTIQKTRTPQVPSQNKTLTPQQAAPLLLDEWKYHNDMFSQALYRYGLAQVFITVAPYLISGLIKELGQFVFFFPGLGIFLSLYGGYHIISLGFYVGQSDKNYRKVMGEYAPTTKLVEPVGGPPRKPLIRIIVTPLLMLMKSIEESLLLENVSVQLAMTFPLLCWIIQFVNISLLVNILNKP